MKVNVNGDSAGGKYVDDVMGGKDESTGVAVADGAAGEPVDSGGDAGGDSPAFGGGDVGCQDGQADCIGGGGD